MTVSKLFEDEPQQWGLRGDPFLWRDLKSHFESTSLPKDQNELKTILEEAYENKTGYPLAHSEHFYIEEYAHGGMSSGKISPEFWRDVGIPTLIKRSGLRDDKKGEWVMKRIFLFGSLIIAVLLAYLVAWPVDIDPQKWEAPKDKGYVGNFAPNRRLADLELLDIGDIHGPEDVASRVIDGQLYLFVSSQDGLIRKINADTKEVTTLADTKGVPLGFEFDGAGNLILADAFKGLLSIAPDGTVTTLSDTADGEPILYADDLDIAPDGVIYFSDASTRWGAAEIGQTMAASLYEIMEHGKTGRVLAYDPASGKTWTVMEDLSFANGVAMADNGNSILVNETGEYRIHKLWVSGPKKGESKVIIDNLPGFPDNINQAPDGNFYVGIVSKRSAFLDDYANSPFWRKLAWRLPAALQPKAENYGFIIEMDGNGNVIQTWQDPTGAYPTTTGAHLAADGYLYISSLTASKLGRMKMAK